MLQEQLGAVEERVDRLEAILGQFMARSGAALLRIDRSIERMEQAIATLRSDAETDRRLWQEERRELARQLGNISNRLGTIAEDIIAPGLRRLAPEALGCGPEQSFAVRLARTHSQDPGRSREFDALFVGEKAVLLNETKATPRPEYARDFVDFLHSGQFFLYFPEFRDRRVVPVFSSLYLPDDLVAYLTGQNVFAVALRDDALQVLNLEPVQAGSG